SLEGLRGIAIISVLLFHIRQDFFANGFLGVDVFFVLSGFLISSILSRHRKLTPAIILDFYGRRFKRIVPLYATVLLLCMISALLLYSSVDMTNAQSSFTWSLFFARNLLQIRDARDYWKQASDSSRDILLHAWSLGVEIQFYLIAPIIALISTMIRSRTGRIIFQSSLAAVSLFLFISSDPTTQFNSPWCRCWQFLLGSIAAEATKDQDTERKPEKFTEDKESLLEQNHD
ncbi:hypothetical protein PMAYCL1PPCAC_20472, partial [Pristionchus mayeri]